MIFMRRDFRWQCIIPIIRKHKSATPLQLSPSVHILITSTPFLENHNAPRTGRHRPADYSCGSWGIPCAQVHHVGDPRDRLHQDNNISLCNSVGTIQKLTNQIHRFLKFFIVTGYFHLNSVYTP